MTAGSVLRLTTYAALLAAVFAATFALGTTFQG